MLSSEARGCCPCWDRAMLIYPAVQKIFKLCNNSCANNMPSRINDIAYSAQPSSASQATSDRPSAFGLG